MSLLGWSESLTTGRFLVSEFNDRFPAMNLKRRRSPGDPFLPLAVLQTGQSAKTRFCELEGYKADVGDLNQTAKIGH
ncbi:MAG: hypothetical protein Q7U98_18185 [Methylicorpusculum sp.]|uniref:hypothetical protein n=1 Tax=Methylicorpusculum sp. TaxID=2713644 RepID=UPI002725D0F7|nr:hypothetical protein [Methylicorpusculum sp.]MDO8941087.1 hypothetical protein [Methylicorpusculum sp.]MDP2202256.1 hypothetical protein [Methylicorpusculum sp.]